MSSLGYFICFLISLATSIITHLLIKNSGNFIDPAELEDFEIPTVDEGREIPVVFGTKLVTGANVVWYGDLRSEEVKR